MNKKSLHLINGEFYAGAEKVQDVLACCLPDYGWDVEFFILKKGVFKHNMQSFSVTHEGFMRSRLDISVILHLFRLIKARRFDVIHSHTIRSLMLLIFAYPFCRIPVFHHCHSSEVISSAGGILDLINQKFDSFLLKIFPGKIIAVSNGALKYLLSVGVPENKISVIFNGVSERDLKSFPSRRDEFFEFVCVALFRQRKGVEVLLDAFAKVVKEFENSRLSLIGVFETTEYKRQIKERIHRLNIDDHVVLEGFCRDVALRISSSDCLVFPSVRPEGMPMVLLEAMSVGLPVIASAVEGVLGVVEDGVSGILVAPDDSAVLADTMKRVVDSRDEAWLKACGLAAQKRQKEFFSEAVMARQVAENYDAAIARIGL